MSTNKHKHMRTEEKLQKHKGAEKLTTAKDDYKNQDN